MAKPTYVDIPGAVGLDQDGNVVMKRTTMPDPVKALPIPLIEREIGQIVDRAQAARRSLTPAEINRLRALEDERLSKEAIRNEAARVEAAKLGEKIARESAIAEERIDGERVISRKNNPDRIARSDEILKRHAKLRQSR